MKESEDKGKIMTVKAESEGDIARKGERRALEAQKKIRGHERK